MKNTRTRARSRRRWIVAVACLIMSLGMSAVAYAQAGRVGVSKPLVLLVVLAGLSLVPFVVMMTTSFVKIAVVLALVRNAIGTQQVPPNIIVTGLAMILTIYIMVPVGYNVYQAAGAAINQGSNQPLLSQASVELLGQAVKDGKEPVRQFLIKNVHKEDRQLFYKLALKLRSEEQRADISDQDFVNLIPAFVVSELTEAFQIGFVLFLPFLIIDLVIANILLSLGMFQISPITISLPFKLLLFVLVNGWQVITKGLILGYV